MKKTIYLIALFTLIGNSFYGQSSTITKIDSQTEIDMNKKAQALNGIQCKMTVESILLDQSFDIDHPKSFLGRVFPFISQYLDRNYGHRTITHGLIFYIITIILTCVIEKATLKTSRYTLIASFSLLSHLLFDMMTVQGIPLLYPFRRNPCVIPGNPELRFKSG